MAGIFGVVSKKDSSETLFDITNALYYGTDYHAHLGTEFGGLALLNENKIERKIHHIGGENFRPKFRQDIKGMEGKYGIGVIGYNIQPIILDTKHGQFAIVTNGLINNSDNLVEKMEKKGVTFSEIQPDGTISQSEVVAKIISSGNSIEEGINDVFKQIKGSVSILLMNEKGIYAARDKHGRSPLIIGSSPSGLAVTTSTTAFPNLEYKKIKELKPGEVTRINENSIEVKKKGSNKINKPCAFLWIYTEFPASTIEGINVEVARERCGACLAKKGNVKADIVAGVPDSGTAHAIGYAKESKIPFGILLVKYIYSWSRSYMPANQEERDLIAKMKLIPIPELIRNMRIILCEDSIVRGTQLRKTVKEKLFAYGAKEVHIRPACPPLMFPCPYYESTRTYKELATRTSIKEIEGSDIKNVKEYLDPNSKKFAKMNEKTRKRLGATTLRYLPLDDMIKAIGRPREKLCHYCWTGKDN